MLLLPSTHVKILAILVPPFIPMGIAHKTCSLQITCKIQMHKQLLKFPTRLWKTAPTALQNVQVQPSTILDFLNLL